MKLGACHSFVDDARGPAFGAVMAAFDIAILTHLGLITGQTAVLAVLLSYATGLPFGAVFFVANLPFYWLGFRRMGVAFSVKTLLAMVVLAGLPSVLPGSVEFGRFNLLFGAVLFGFVAGAGLLALFRHGASLGGSGILALLFQARTGFRVGWTQLLCDAGLFAAALLVLDVQTVALSALGAIILNLVIAINHRRDRYAAY